jgi:cell division protein FtsL
LTTITFDTQELVNELENSGFTRQQSETVVSVLKRAQSDLTTKSDIATLASKIDMQEMELRLVKWVFGVALGQVAVIAALVKLL